MDIIILRYIAEFYRQVRKRLLWVIVAGTVISFLVLAGGMLYHPKYKTSITIFADHQNVIKPLLQGQAAVTSPKSQRIRVVKEVMFSPSILERVINAAIDPNLQHGSDKMEAMMKQLRKEISVSAPADDYITVSYANKDPKVAYRVVNKITNLFIEKSAENKRTESKNAYNFIDQQVNAYKDKLVEAENKLKAFNAGNTDGVESQVAGAISRLQTQIDQTTVDIEAEQVRIAALEDQLSKQNRYAANDYSAQVYRDRLAKLQAKMQTLKLNYRDDYPDVVDLRLQIEDLKKTIVEVEDSNRTHQPDDLTGEQQLNPIYQQLTNQLSDAKVDLEGKKQRLAADQKRLKDQFARQKRIAANQAELSDLTRDYKVDKGIYENLLERKEKARISMTLDLSGEGLSYKVLEPAIFPVVPTGLRFLHFVIAGPIFGGFVPLALIGALVFLDPRIKFAEQLNGAFPGIVLAVLPPARQQPTPWRLAAISTASAAVLYLGASLTFHFI